MKRVMHLVLSLDCGGQEKMIIQLAEGLNRTHPDYENFICYLEGRGELVDEARQKNLNVVALKKGKGFDWGLIFRLRDVLKKEKVDLVHTHNLAPLIYGSLAARSLGLKAVNTRHGRAPKRTYPFIWNWNAQLVAVSEDARQQLLTSNRVDQGRVRVIYNAINPLEFQGSGQGAVKKRIIADLGLRRDTQLLGIVARLSKEKDHKTLLKAFSKIVPSVNAALLVIGDGSLRNELEQFAETLQVEDRIRFLGFRQDIPELLSALDCFALSSTTEGVSLTLLEAMAAGKPVVATRVGGNPEVVDHEKTGLLVPAGDVDLMAGALLKILSNPDLGHKLGQQGQKRVKDLFSLQQMVRAYKDVYEQVLTHG